MRHYTRCERLLIPVEQCGRAVELQPGGRTLSGRDLAPLRHQVWELPEIKPVVTEYQRQRWKCLCCRETMCAELPEGVACRPVRAGRHGPRSSDY